jgi:hypothetical protein
MPKVTMTTREIEQMITDAVRKTPACQAFQSISLYIVPQLQRQYDAMESTSSGRSRWRTRRRPPDHNWVWRRMRKV